MKYVPTILSKVTFGLSRTLTDMITKVVYHIDRYGLCNRLRCLAAMQALAALHQVELCMLWEPGITCPASFDDLFEPVCTMVSPAEMDRFRLRNDIRLVAGKGAGNRPEFYGKGEVFTQHWKFYVRQLRPLPHILQKINDHAASVWNDHMVGVHVRRTDAVADRGRRLGITFRDTPIIDAMHKEVESNPETRFSFATDNEKTLQLFVSEFGERLTCYPKGFECFDPAKHSLYGSKQAIGHRHTSVEDAVIDLWLLSRTNKIIGTMGSSFSEHAAWIGNVPIQWL